MDKICLFFYLRFLVFRKSFRSILRNSEHSFNVLYNVYICIFYVWSNPPVFTPPPRFPFSPTTFLFQLHVPFSLYSRKLCSYHHLVPADTQIHRCLDALSKIASFCTSPLNALLHTLNHLYVAYNITYTINAVPTVVTLCFLGANDRKTSVHIWCTCTHNWKIF